MLNNTIKSKIDQLWDKFWSGGIANPLTAIEQISYLLFMRRLDAIDRKRKEDAESLGHTYDSPFAGKDDCRWSNFRNLPGSQMLTHVRENVFEFIKTLRGEESLFTKYMKDAVFLIPKDSLLVEAVSIIDEIYDEIERQRQEEGQTFHDTQGDIYEHLLSEISSAGKNGQFRTPRHIIQMITTMVNPKLGERVVDPAAGTGGFLLAAYQHIVMAHTSQQHRFIDDNGLTKGLSGDQLTDERQWQVLREHTFNGFDMDQTMVRIGLMNLLLHGIDRPSFQYADTLSKQYGEVGLYDVCLANPPFKGSIDKGDINEGLSLPTTKTEILFVELMIRLLRIGGRAGVIVPLGVLEGESRAHNDLRKRLVESNQLQAVVELPHFVFKPYASVATAVLFFVKGGVTEDVLVYRLSADGYADGAVRKKIKKNDIPCVLDCWERFRADPELIEHIPGKAAVVSVDDIKSANWQLAPGELLRRVAAEDTRADYPRHRLDQLCFVKKGPVGASVAADGPYAFFTTAEVDETHSEAHFSEPSVIVPLVSSTGHGHASIKRIKYADGEFSAASIVAVVTPKSAKTLNAKYLFYYLSVNKDLVLVPLMKGSANKAMSVGRLSALEIPVPPASVQAEMISQLIQIEEQRASLNNRLEALAVQSDELLAEVFQHFV